MSGDCVLLLPNGQGEEYNGVPDLELPNDTKVIILTVKIY